MFSHGYKVNQNIEKFEFSILATSNLKAKIQRLVPTQHMVFYKYSKNYI